jgi:hypothetical protein
MVEGQYPGALTTAVGQVQIQASLHLAVQGPVLQPRRDATVASILVPTMELLAVAYYHEGDIVLCAKGVRSW